MEEKVAVSACLLGVRCRYDGGHKAHPRALALAARAVAVCPEELGGLGTPRPAAALEGGGGEEVWEGRARVVTVEGIDVTEAYREGARRALEAARAAGVRRALFKQHSPSCGCGSAGAVGGRIAADGVATALFRRAGIEVVAEEDPL